MYIFEYEKSELNMFTAGMVIERKPNDLPKIRGVFYDTTDGFEKGTIGYPLTGEENRYDTAEEMMREAIPYIFEEWK